MEWIAGLLVILVLVILVGHGLWELIALIFRGGSPRPGRGGGPPLRVCANCGRGLASTEASCSFCATAIGLPPATELYVAEKQLHRLVNEGLLTPEALAAVWPALKRERERIDAAARPATPPPLPVRPSRPVPVIPVERPTEPEHLGPADEPPAASDSAAAPPAGTRRPTGFVPPPTRAPQAAAPPPALPLSPRRPWTAVLASFMEQKNIRWGELVGGLLIVGCSAALVLSFWAEIAQRPVLKFSIFTAVAGALFGLGLYSEHRWKLPTTSRGILLIAALLVPLNFLAFAAFSQDAPAADAVAVGGEAVAFVLFLALLYAAARVIAPLSPMTLTAGVMALSLASLAVRYAAPAGGTVPAAGVPWLAAVMLACYAAPVGATLERTRRRKELSAGAADGVLTLLGVLSFAVVAPLGLLAYKSGDVPRAVRQMAPLLGLAGAPALAAGLLLWRRAADGALARVRMVGSGVAVAGAMVMVAGIALAWPDPGRMLPIAACDGLALAALAVAFRVPAGHVLAAACGVFAYLLGYHVVTGHVGWTSSAGPLLQALGAPGGAPPLVLPVLILLAAGEAFRRGGRPGDAAASVVSAVGAAAISLALATVSGIAAPGDPYHLAWLCAAYAATAFAVAVRTERRAAGWTGWTLLLAGTCQWMASRAVNAAGWATGLLAYATVAATVAYAVGRSIPAHRRTIGEPARWGGRVASAAALVFIAVGAARQEFGPASLRAGWLAVLWLAVAVEVESAGWFAAGQAILAGAAALGAVSAVYTRDWFREAVARFGMAEALSHAWTVQAVAIALGLTCVAWAAARRLLARGPAGEKPVDGLVIRPASWRRTLADLLGERVTVDRAALPVAGAVLLGLALFAVAPAVAAEFSPPAAAVASPPGASAAAGWGSWVLLAVVLLGFGGRFAEGRRLNAARGAAVVAWAACPLVAAGFGTAGASALRWAALAYLLAGEGMLRVLGRRAGAADRNESSPVAKLLSRAGAECVAALGLGSVVLLTTYPTAAALFAEGVRGPAAESIFGRMGPGASYALPLLAAAGLAAAGAVRRRSAGWAFAGMLLADLGATAGYVMASSSVGPFDLAHAVRLVQIDVAVTSAFCLAWLAAPAAGARRRGFDAGPAVRPALLAGSVAVAVAAMGVLALPGMAALLLDPIRGGTLVTEPGGMLGWLAVGLAGVAAAWVVLTGHRGWSVGGVALAATAGAAMTAFTVVGRRLGTWDGFHAWMVAQTAAAWGLLGLGWWMRRRGRGVAVPAVVPSMATAGAPHSGLGTGGAAQPLSYERVGHAGATGGVAEQVVYVGGEDVRRSAGRWAGALGAGAVLLAMRATLGDPAVPWWSVAVVMAVGLLTTAAAVWLAAPGYLYGSGLLLNLAATLGYLFEGGRFGGNRLVGLLDVNAAMLALPGLAWLVLELQVFRRRAHVRRGPWPAFHHAAALASAFIVAGVAALTLGSDLAGGLLASPAWLGWAAAAAAAALAAASLWDEKAGYALPALYALGLSVAALALDATALPPDPLAWAGGLLLAGYLLLTGGIWAGRAGLAAVAQPLGVQRTSAASVRTWLVPASMVLATTVAAVAYWADFTLAAGWMRLLAAAGVLIGAAGLALLTRGTGGTRVREAALLLVAAALVAGGWAALGPQADALQRAVAAAVLLVPVACAAALAAGRLAPAGDWGRAVVGTTPLFGWVAMLSIGAALAAEISAHVAQGRVPLHPLGIGAMAAVLGAACATCLATALRASDNSTSMTVRRRSAYVYGAEALLGAALVHLRLTVPELFGGFVRPYWPLAIMAVAFAGVGAGEVLRRRGQIVLGGPLANTGVLLPVLPVIAFWFAGSRVDYSALLLTAAALYASVAVARRSFRWGLLAALAGNAALWYGLHRTESLGFLVHPQLWVIPAALSLLAAGELNRDRVRPADLRSLRYACLSLVYVSSTADIFINGAAHSPWLPLVLAALAVAGVFAGISLRVRSFLFLGTGFLGLAVVSMIWNAAADLHWTWLWYVAGILLGLCIILVFALFEKKREEMLALVEGLRAWQ